MRMTKYMKIRLKENPSELDDVDVGEMEGEKWNALRCAVMGKTVDFSWSTTWKFL